MRIFFLITFFMLLAAGMARAADYTDSVVQDHIKRNFLVHIPDAAQEALPVVLVLHGGGGNAAQIRGQTGMDAVADRNGFIAVYPEGTTALIGNFRTWNAGLCCGAAAKKNINDVAFISAVIDKLVEKYNADRTRIYATGHSNGAMMSYRLACALADKIAAIAPNAGQRAFKDCHPSRPVAVLHIHGTNDPCALYNGGAHCGGCFSEALGIHLPGDTWPCAPVKEIVHAHAVLNGCGQETETFFTKGAVSCLQYKGCPANAAVALCTLAGAGHRWPGTTDIGPPACKAHPDRKICKRYTDTVGPANTDVNAGELMWSFFKGIHL